ncbi:hypothetical protein [Pluralibacter sp.]|jgi:hypothetical protein|uniref:hypothetical protein n=1 Tax=Pluralibacter sp. TaxID=1920032 RepID=UPI0025ECFAC0|nr:hypothetical protein [Pluralibacter sp.]MBV8042087.1 hypothetical protein [Pluralibacter sp.]
MVEEKRVGNTRHRGNGVSLNGDTYLFDISGFIFCSVEVLPFGDTFPKNGWTAQFKNKYENRYLSLH